MFSSKKFVNAESIQSAKDEAALDRIKKLKNLQKHFDTPPPSNVFAGPAIKLAPLAAASTSKPQEDSDEEDLKNIVCPPSSSEESESEWAEKDVPAVVTAPKPPVEDIDLANLLEQTSTRKEKKESKPNELRRAMQQVGLLKVPNSAVDRLTTIDAPGTHAKELNPYWKDGGEGLPEEKPHSKPANNPPVSTSSGGADVEWLKRALLRCKQLAKDEGRSLDEVVAERYGSLDELQQQIDNAERRASMAITLRQYDEKKSDSNRKSFMNPSQDTRDSRDDRGRNNDRDRERRRDRDNDERSDRDHLSDRRDDDRRDNRDSRDGRGDRRNDDDSRRDSRRNDDDSRRDSRRNDDDGRRDNRRDDRDRWSGNRREVGPQPRPQPQPRRQVQRRSESSEESEENSGDRSPSPVARRPNEPSSSSNKAAAASLRTQLNFPSAPAGSRRREQEEEQQAAPKAATSGDRNKAAAAALRAQLFGGSAPQPAKAASKPSKESSEEEDDNNNTEVVLKTSKKSGLTMPYMASSCGGANVAPGGRRKLETHSKSGERLRFLPGEDQMSVGDMVAMEKASDAQQQNSLYMRFSGKEKLNDDFDIDDAYVEKASKRKTIQNHELAEKRRAVAEHKQTSRALSSCNLCIEKVVKHLVIAFGEKSYLAIPSEVSLVQDHCQIIPRDHVRAITLLEDDAWEEVQVFKKSVYRMFADQGQDVVFMETCMPSKTLGHTLIECFPLEGEAAELAPIFFKKALLDSEGLWSNNKKVIDIKDNIKKTIPSAFSYFAVEFGIGGQGFAHIIENEQKFPAYFGKEVIGGMIDAEPGLWRRPAKDSVESQLDKSCRLQRMYAKYNWTNGSIGARTEAASTSSNIRKEAMDEDDDEDDDS